MNKTIPLAAISLAALFQATSLCAADIGKQAYERSYTRDRFERADSDGDGFVTLEEATAVSNGFDGIKGRERFDAADTDGNGRLSLEEAAARKQLERKHGPQRAGQAHDALYNRERFEAADADGDGLLSREEAAADKAAADLFSGRRFDRADINGDGMLSLREAAQQKKNEAKAF